MSHNKQPGQPLQAGAVSIPGGGAGCGNAPVVIQIYAVGRGIARGGEAGSLLGREGTFELQANGVVFVFDPVAACHAHGLVMPVDGHVKAIGLPLQPINQKVIAEFGGGCLRHEDASCGAAKAAATVIVTLPAGSGKTALAPELARRLGCAHVVDAWQPGRPLQIGALHLTNAPLASFFEAE